MPSITESGLEAISDVRLFVYQLRHSLAIKLKYFNNLLVATLAPAALDGIAGRTAAG
jgi:hypothetical protein